METKTHSREYDKFIFHRSYFDATDGFETTEEAKEFIWNVVLYGLFGDEPEKQTPEFCIARSLIDKYRESIGGRPKKTTNNKKEEEDNE